MATTDRRWTTRHTAACALSLTTGVVIGLALNGDDSTPAAAPQTAPTSNARIEATPAPGSTIPVEQLQPAERIYIDGLRVWGSTAMDTHRWTDRDLLTYGKGTCAALKHAHNPADYLARMDALVPATAPHTPRADLGTAEAEAVSLWCPDYIDVLPQMRH